ncbi:MAG: hypothetical protein R3335_02280 [Anaerolineales bacterium]|nr:hypothetical protein [Anaerolineales bacterium]
MVIGHIILHGFLYALVVNGYLLLTMVATSPRVWGYSDYSDEIKAKIPPQTRQERRLAIVIAIPWLFFAVAFPIYSSLILKNNLGGEIPFWQAFLNIAVMVLLASLVDLVVLDWLIISKITPAFVVIPGTTETDYKDLSYHYRAQARAGLGLLAMSLILATVVVLL